MYTEEDVVFDDVPVSAALRVLSRFDELSEEDSEDVIEWNEVQRLVFLQDFEPLFLAIPRQCSDVADYRQLEEEGGRVVDVSAFASRDFLDGRSFDGFRYFSNKAAEQAKRLAILHSCISDVAGRVQVRERFVSFVNGKYGDSARRLAERVQKADDEEVRAELASKLRRQQREVARLWGIWQELAYDP